jgi:hypothetical protein
VSPFNRSVPNFCFEPLLISISSVCSSTRFI